MRSLATVQNPPSELPCLLPRVHVVENTTEVNGDSGLVTSTSEAREYLRRLFARWTPEWHSEALCREFGDVGPWFPARGANRTRWLSRCAATALSAPSAWTRLGDPSPDHGIRAGTTANARKTMRRNRQRQSADVPTRRRP
jgi:hypothetical protein